MLKRKSILVATVFLVIILVSGCIEEVSIEKTIPEINPENPAILEIEACDIEKIEINVKEKAENVKINIKSVTENPYEAAPSGEVYNYFKIEAENLSKEKILKIKIDFKVPKSWINLNKIDINTIILNKFTNKWETLETEKLREDSNFIYYESICSALSYFVITGKVGQEIEVPKIKSVIVKFRPENPEPDGLFWYGYYSGEPQLIHAVDMGIKELGTFSCLGEEIGKKLLESGAVPPVKGHSYCYVGGLQFKVTDVSPGNWVEIDYLVEKEVVPEIKKGITLKFIKGLKIDDCPFGPYGLWSGKPQLVHVVDMGIKELGTFSCTGEDTKEKIYQAEAVSAVKGHSYCTTLCEDFIQFKVTGVSPGDWVKIDYLVEKKSEEVTKEPPGEEKATKEPPVSSEVTKAYQEYIEAKKKLTDLMNKGKTNTPEGKAAYEEYKAAKAKYEALVRKGK